jgi:hypothetical protein
MPPKRGTSIYKQRCHKAALGGQRQDPRFFLNRSGLNAVVEAFGELAIEEKSA